ncbi:DUF6256 family protein [Streptomyces radicis]|uniref:Uncharacterized protein n=1 Tax=Streptomyces radicis TaxID=1750517 RepID=A0A3A9VWF8_9ACTN|nr:DUF6256 family protein [Streptomyces radicis]RKN05345.1 hypothetical protein D7319_25340 [Streptomyces radicis]RKN16852.1 hypothetical protein D7318_24705 [Streptomyces radicis]
MSPVLDLVVMLTAYLLVMGYLAIGVRTLLRDPNGGPRRRSDRRGWPELLRQVAVTAVGGHVLLLVVVAAYYVAVAHHDMEFVLGAVTGTASLTGVALPLLLALMWLTHRRG